MATIRLLIADDAAEVRAALGELLGEQPHIELIGSARDAAEAVELATELQPDVALLDVRMPGQGAGAARGIARSSPGTRIVALSAHDDREAVVGMISAGASSYVTKGSRASEIIEAVTRAAEGATTISEGAAREVVGELNDQMQANERRRVTRERQLARIQQALHPDALTIHYQPIFDLERRTRQGVEALARFSPEPYRTPDVWFAEAWEVGLGIDLELAAIRAAAEILSDLPDPEFLAVNISPATACSSRLGEVLPPGAHRRLVLEVTEHAPVDDYDHLASCLEAYRRAGLRLAVDDAGAGYASLHHTLRLDPDIIKLDMSLTRDLHLDSRRRALVAALVPFATEIGATVIAEGVESEPELEALRGFGASWGQGYLLARPGPFHEVADTAPREPQH
jgi:EAL domain-containing protein (putative c-di-GMP-specific phosphodiesterase class I)/DNA-binding NarL/FixJ family response regulator